MARHLERARYSTIKGVFDQLVFYMVGLASGSLIYGIILIVLGVLGVIFPFVFGSILTAILGWLILFVAVIRLVQAFNTRQFGGPARLVLRLLEGLLYAIAGLYIVTHPAMALAALALWIGIVFIVEAVSEFALVFTADIPNKAWVILDGFVTLLLGLAILRQWPLTGMWVVGTLVGLSLIFSGVSAVSLGLALKSEN